MGKKEVVVVREVQCSLLTLCLNSGKVYCIITEACSTLEKKGYLLYASAMACTVWFLDYAHTILHQTVKTCNMTTL